MARTDRQINIRLPDDLVQRVAAEATANKRSTTAEIAARLEGGGMTLRDYFAGQALAGITAGPNGPHQQAEVVATIAYRYADALLAERAKPDAIEPTVEPYPGYDPEIGF